MAVPVLAGRRAGRLSASPHAAEHREIRLRSFGHSYLWIILALLAAALLSRIYTTNSLAGEPTSDEYLYAVHARDLDACYIAAACVQPLCVIEPRADRCALRSRLAEDRPGVFETYLTVRERPCRQRR